MTSKQPTILIIDDAPHDREMYRRFLTADPETNYRIIEEETAAAGLFQCRSQAIDGILLDFLLPDADGLEFLSELQEQSGETCPTIVMITGQGDEKVAARAIKQGAEDYLVKRDITPDGLRLAVRTAIVNGELRRQLKLAQERERIVQQIAQQIRQSLELEDVLQTTVTEVRRFLDCDRVIIFSLQPDGSGVVIAESVGSDWLSILSTTIADPCFAESYIGAYRQGRVTTKADIFDGTIDLCHVELLHQFRVRANLVVPILQGDQLWGLLIAHQCGSPRQWEALEVELLKQLALQAGIAIQQSQLYQQVQTELWERRQAEAALRQQTERERLVSAIAQRIRQSLELEAVLVTTVTEVRAFLQTDRVFVYRFQPDFTGVVVAESISEGWLPIIHAQVEDTYFVETRGEAYRQGRIQAVADIAEAGLTDCHRELLERFQIRANLAVPILQADQLWGLLVANHCCEPRPWQPLEIELLQQLSTQIGIALQQSELYQRARHELAERQRTELALQASEQRYRQLAEAMPAMVWSAAASGAVTYFNDRWYDYTGLSVSESMGIDGVRAVHPEDRDRTLEQWSQAILAGEAFQIEHRIQHQSGEFRWFMNRGLPTRDAAAQITGWVGTISDIHDRVCMEQALRDSQRFSHDVALATPGILYVYDLVEQRNVYANRQLTDLLGYTPEQAAAMGSDFLPQLFHPQDWSNIPAHIAQFASAADGTVFELEYRMQQANGEWRWFWGREVVFSRTPEGSPQQILGIAHDITQRKQAEFACQQSEARLRQLVDLNLMGVMFWDVDGTILEANDAFLSMLGYNRDDLAAGLNWRALTPPEQLEWSDRSLAEMQQQTSAILEKEYLHKQGHRIPILLGGVMFIGSQSRGVSFVVDLSERKQAEAALQQSQERLQRMIDTAPIGIGFGTANGEVWAMNEAMLQIYGISREEFEQQGLNWQQCSPPEYAEQNQRAMAQLFQGQAVEPAEKEIIRADGSRISVWISANQWGDNPGDHVAFAIDLSQQKQTEQALQQANERFEFAAAAVNCLIWDWDLQTHRVERTRGLVELLGYDPAEAEPTVQWWLDRLHPEDLARMDRNAFYAQLPTLDRFTGEYRVQHRDGHYLWVEETGFVVKDETGNPVRIVGSTTNISDRKHSELALQKARSQLESQLAEIEAIYQYTPVGLAVLDRELRFVRLNEQLAEINGFAIAAHLGRSVREIVPALADTVEPLLQQVLATGEPMLNLEISGETAAQPGVTRTWIKNWYPLRDLNGEIIGINTVVQEITQRKQFEQALLERESLFRGVFDSKLIGILFWNIQGQITDANETFSQMTGYSRDELQTGRIYYRDITPSEYHAQDAEKFAQLLSQGSYTPFEKEYICKDGSRLPILLGCTFLPGDRDRGVAFALDITERKQAEQALRDSEERYRQLVDICPDGILIQSQGLIVFANPSMLAFLGVDGPEQLIGQPVLVFIHDDYKQMVRDRMQLLEQGQAVPTLEEKWLCVDGEMADAEVAAVPLVYQGCPAGLVVVRDISDRKQLEAKGEKLLLEAEAARAEAEAANRSKDEFIAVVSHELRSPLNAILGWSRLLRTREYDQTMLDRALETIERNAQSQVQLIEDLLDVSRMIRGNLRLTFAPVSLAIVVENAITNLRPVAESKNLQVQVYLDTSLGWISGDQHRLQQIVTNLLTNAIKFTPEGGRIEVRLERQEGDIRQEGEDNREQGIGNREQGTGNREQGTGNREQGTGNREPSEKQDVAPFSTQPSAIVPQPSAFASEPSAFMLLSVSDTGKGISPQFLPHVFDRFRQADNTSSSSKDGLGLGLAIVHHLVTLHRGSITAESRGEGLGATFTVILPLLGEPQPASLDPALSIPHDSPSTPLPLKDLRILVVDDEADSREFVQFVLTEAGAIVTVADSAAAAWSCLSQCQPQLLISDIGMPDQDGYTLLQRLRSLPPEQGGQIPAIALTAYAKPEDRQRSLDMGFAAHLVKPIEPSALIIAIANLMALDSQNR